jgi:hypothetical protein
MSIPQWVKDIDDAAYPMPFGDIDVQITRHRSKTTKVTYSKESKIHPKDNVEGFSDLEKLINSMVLAQFDGKLHFALDFKKGTMQVITIKNKEIKNYG